MVSKVSSLKTRAWQRRSIVRSNSGVECNLVTVGRGAGRGPSQFIFKANTIK